MAWRRRSRTPSPPTPRSWFLRWGSTKLKPLAELSSEANVKTAAFVPAKRTKYELVLQNT
jgi:hypothetical protein